MQPRAVHFSIFNLHLPPRVAILAFLNQPRAIFLDRDGTVIQEKEYLHRPEQVAILPGAAEALRRLREAGFKLFIVSNQSGVGRGRFTLEDVAQVTPGLPLNWPATGCVSTEYMSPPKRPEQPSRARKPSPQFLLDARDEFGLRLEDSFFVGDKMMDLECGWNAGVRKSILVRTGYGREVENSGDPRLAAAIIVDDLPAAAAWIMSVTLSITHDSSHRHHSPRSAIGFQRRGRPLRGD